MTFVRCWAGPAGWAGTGANSFKLMMHCTGAANCGPFPSFEQGHFHQHERLIFVCISRKDEKRNKDMKEKKDRRKREIV